jgi:outer membrane protein assembly factor BamB
MTRLTDRRTAALIVLVLLVATTLTGRSAGDGWPQWGGPGRDFMSPATGLASSWPADGPAELWRRDLGEGHSSVAVEGDRLFTIYRPVGLLSMVKRNQEEVAIAIDATSGRTIWEYTFSAPTSGLNLEFGAGPHSTPLVAGNLVITAGSRGDILALDKVSGRKAWAHDLVEQYGAAQPDRGYACSPLGYGDTVIVTAGGRPGQSVMAFRQSDGALVWKAGDFSPSPGSPIVITLNGQEQLVVLGENEVVGMNPSTGEILWSHPHQTSYGLNISTPVWTPAEGQLVVSSAYNNGTRALQLDGGENGTTVRERWYTNRLRVHFTSMLRLGDVYVGSNGDFGPGILTAVDAATGEVVWQSRGFARANLIAADGKVIVLDEDGALGLTTVSEDGIDILSMASVLSSRAWTVPALSGTTLYARDRQELVALDLAP